MSIMYIHQDITERSRYVIPNQSWSCLNKSSIDNFDLYVEKLRIDDRGVMSAIGVKTVIFGFID